ncbi:hypothetical protein OURE66S_00304 [Oligella ureolytica]
MSHAAQIKIPATYMRGGTSKGLFSASLIYRRLHNNPEQRVTLS